MSFCDVQSARPAVDVSTVELNPNRKADEAVMFFPQFMIDVLKDHQVGGVRFLWERCIGSPELLAAGDKGKGCILAHSMGLGKTIQVLHEMIVLYTQCKVVMFVHLALRLKSPTIQTVLILVPINTLHNWASEFRKWLRKSGPPVYVIDDKVKSLASFSCLSDFQIALACCPSGSALEACCSWFVAFGTSTTTSSHRDTGCMHQFSPTNRQAMNQSLFEECSRVLPLILVSEISRTRCHCS